MIYIFSRLSTFSAWIQFLESGLRTKRCARRGVRLLQVHLKIPMLLRIFILKMKKFLENFQQNNCLEKAIN